MSGPKPVIVYDDHRFVVPVLWLAHQHGIIDGKTSMVRFDAHYDALDVKPQVGEDFKKLKDFARVFAFCRDHLGPIDDDWQSFVFQTNLIQHVYLFCNRKDQLQSPHLNRMSITRNFEYNETLDKAKSIVLDIDCDHFVYAANGKIHPWSEELYHKEFSEYFSFMQKIVQRSPFITICLEPDFCGGRDKAHLILEQLKKLFFS